MEVKLSKAEGRLAEAEEKRLIADLKSGITGLDADEIAEAGKRGDKLGEVARDISRELVNDPLKVIADSLEPLSLSRPDSLVARIAAVQERQEHFSTPNRPVEIPYLTRDNIKNLGMQVKTGNGQKVLDFFSAALPEDRLKMAKQLSSGTKDEVGLALVLTEMDNDPALANDMLKALSSDKSLLSKSVVNDVSPYASEAANSVLRTQSRTLGRLEEYQAGTDAINRVANIQDINPGIFAFEKLIPVPSGYNGRQFRSRLDDLMRNPDQLAKYANGKMLGGQGIIDVDSVEVVAFEPGIYVFKVDGKPIATEDGSYFAVDMRRALDDVR